MQKIALFALMALALASCDAPMGSRFTVTGTGEEEFLKLRAGPGLGFKAILGLPDGTELSRRGCVTEVGQLWCKVSLARAPEITGFVAADYLSPSP